MIAVVTGVIATYPVGGVAWDYGQYALGLERLGFDVYYLEDSGLATYDADRNEYGEDPTYGLEFLQDCLGQLSPTLGERWHFRHYDGRTYGLADDDLREVVAACDVFLNVSGLCRLREEYLPARRKVLIDTDPGWNHFHAFPRWDAELGSDDSRSFREHDSFFTYALRLGSAACVLPDLGLSWHPTVPPVVLDCWPLEPPGDRWTTVLTWDNYAKPVLHDGVAYGSKEPELARVEDLPRRVHPTLELAVGGSGAPRERFRELGWSVIESVPVTQTMAAYRSYIGRSRGEFSVAKNIYVATGSGWFSCRSTCYLAAGRPVVLQDTGFSAVLPTGLGLVAFSTPDQAVAGIEAVEADYAAHSKAARRLAEEHFSAERVLSDLLARAGVS